MFAESYALPLLIVLAVVSLVGIPVGIASWIVRDMRHTRRRRLYWRDLWHADATTAALLRPTGPPAGKGTLLHLPARSTAADDNRLLLRVEPSHPDGPTS